MPSILIIYLLFKIIPLNANRLILYGMKNQQKNRSEDEVLPSELAKMAYNASPKIMLFSLAIKYLENSKKISESEAIAELYKIANLFNALDNE